MAPAMIIKSMPDNLYQRALRSWVEKPSGSSSRNDVVITDSLLIEALTSELRMAALVFKSDLFRCYNRDINIDYNRFMYATQRARSDATPVRQRHLDLGKKVVIGLWYFADPRDTAGGNLILGSMTIPYQENIMVIFPNTIDAWHEVTPRGPSTYPRRFINFVGEISKPLHNYSRDRFGFDRVYEVKSWP